MQFSFFLTVSVCSLVNISGFRAQRFQGRKSTSLFVDESEPESYRTRNSVAESITYYKGLITDPITDLQVNPQTASTRDNLTPNLRLGGIFMGILFGLFELFILSNKDIPPPPY